MKIHAIRPAENAGHPQEVEVVEFEQLDERGVDTSTEKVVARGYLGVHLVGTPEPGADFSAGVAFYGMGVES